MKLSKLFIIFCLGLALSGFAAIGFVSFIEKQKGFDSKNVEKAKERALKAGLKDEQGNPLISSDEFRQHLLANETGYQIVYQEKGDLFLISINGLPFDEMREKAEKKFLSLIQAPPEIACQLNVEVVTTRQTNPDLAGKTLPLSFCQK